MKKLKRKRVSKIHKHKSKKGNVFWKRGTITLYVLLVVIILGAFFLAGGFPKFDFSPTDGTPAGEVILETPDPQRDSLQLKTLKFKGCASTAAVDFLVDTSGSMRDGGKMQNIKDALASFASNFNDKSVTGIRRFSSDDSYYCAPHPVTERLTQIDFFGNNKNSFTTSTNSFCADGATNTRTAFAAELDDLTRAVGDQRFKDYNFNLVFISDGIPEINGSGHQGACTGAEPYQFCALSKGACRCFVDDQDPTSNPQIAQQVQALKSINGKNVRVFSVLVFDPISDGPFESKLTNMMQAIASSPSDFYKTSDPTTIKTIYSQISNRICSTQ